jgi:ferritin
LEAFENDERTRSFLSMLVEEGREEVRDSSWRQTENMAERQSNERGSRQQVV